MFTNRGPALLTCLLIGGVVLGSCVKESPKERAVLRRVSIQPLGTTEFRCPEHDIQILIPDSVIDTIPIARQTGMMPEYHDCQRLMIDAKTYGPLVAIWASESLASLFPQLPNGGQDTMAFGVAEILNYGTGPAAYTAPAEYRPLSIQLGWSCVYLWRTSAPDSFTARMVHQEYLQDLQSCATPRRVDEVASAPALSVHAFHPLGTPHEGLPPVARWDQDTTSMVQYISIRCGSAWCEIGPERGFRSSLAVFEDAGRHTAISPRYEADGQYPVPPARWNQMMQVKGWYDQQILERWDSTRDMLVPSGVRATIIPNPVLDVIGSGTGSGLKFNGRWVPAAYIQVDQPYNGKHLRLHPGVSRVYLCHGAVGACSGASAVSGPVSTSSDLWWSKLVAPGGEVVYHSVYFNTHGGGVLPAGAARWRWQEDDATTWLRCDNGCCTDN